MDRNRFFKSCSFRIEGDDILCGCRFAFSWWLTPMIDQELDAIDKVHVFYDHAKVNGVEVLAAFKTPRQIGIGFDRCMPAGAKGTAEPEYAFERF